MRIREFAIDRFGVLHDQRVSDLSPGITVILGDNEAGKSTCLNFFRAMLFGYARNRRSIDYLSDVKAVSGGSLLLESEHMGLLRLSRKPGPHGGPFILAGEDGAPRPEADLAVLLRGCTPDLYDKVFAFSLGELMEFSSLTDDSIRHALHGAAFGTGLRSPGQVLKILDDDMKRIFAPRASTSKIHRLLHDFEALNATIRERGNEVDRYAALAAERDDAANELETVRQARLALEEDRRVLERTMALRHRWEAFREAENAFAACVAVEGEFTPDGRERLDRLLERLDDRQHALSAARLALERANEDLAAEAIDPALVAAAAPLRSLLERKERLREAVARTRVLDAEREALERDIGTVCADLGPGWNAARLETADFSLATHEACRSLGAHLADAAQATAAAEREYERLTREENAAAHAVEDARRALHDAGETDEETGAAPVDEAVIERLAHLLVRAEDAYEKTGALALAVRNAEHALDQAVAAIDSSWTRQTLEAANAAPAERDAVFHLARRVLDARTLLTECEREKKSVETLHDDAAERVAGIESTVTAQAGVLLGQENATAAEVAASLEMRRRLLRRAQTARKTLETAEAAYRAANEQLGDIASLVRGSRRKSAFPWGLVVLFLAAIALVSGAGAMYLGTSGGQEMLTRAGTGALAAGGALALAWLALFARGGDAAAEAMESNWAAIEKRLVRQRMAAQAARDDAEEALEILTKDAPDLFPDGAADQETLLEAEQDLAALKERLAILERDAAELEREKTVLAAAQKRLGNAERAWDEARTAEGAAFAAWQTALATNGLPETLPPDDARVIFERLDAALSRKSALHGRIAEQEAARERIGECLRAAKAVPALADALASLPEPDSHFAPDHGPWLALVRDHLARWRDYGRERIRLGELAAVRASRLEEVTALRIGAEEGLRTARQSLAEAETNWRSWLEDLALSSALSPETARLALEAGGRAKNALDAARRITAQRDDICRDTAAFVTELATYVPLLPEHPAAAGFVNAGQMLPDAAGMAAMLSFLDDLAETARVASEKAAIRKARERELPALADAVALAEEQAASARAECDEMLRLGKCETPEAFRRAHAAWEKRENALDAKRTLKAALEREAADAGLTVASLAASLGEAGREEMEERLEGRKREVGEALAKEHALAERKGGLETAMAGLMNEKGLTALLARRESLNGELTALSREWSRLAVARELLLAAKGRFESERQTGVVREAGELFSAITGGAYSGITVSLDDESVGAVSREGHVRNPETELSRGTREQLYLALRLAYVLDHGAQAEKLPVVMDDILVNFDAARARNTAAALASFAARHQVLFFTCHEATATLLAEASGETTLFTLEKGTFASGGTSGNSRKKGARA